MNDNKQKATLWALVMFGLAYFTSTEGDAVIALFTYICGMLTVIALKAEKPI